MASTARPSGHRDRTLEAAEIFVAATSGVVDALRASPWDVGRPLTPVVSRAVLCRQHDYLAAASELVRQQRGWAVVPLLRPACEELIWLSVLAGLDEPVRERILLALAALDVSDDIRAQAQYHGREAMIELGFDPSLLAATDERRRQLRATLNSEFRALGFHLRRGQAIPTVATLADRADLRRLYDFIYHASSTTVHYKPGQLLRGVWGEPGAMRVDLAPVESRLADFGLYWNVRLTLDTFIAGLPLVEDESKKSGGVDADAIERAAELLSEGERPFVLPDELDWPSAP